MPVGFTSPDMTCSRNQRILLAITALLFSTLACRAATRLILPDTPTPLPPTAIPPTPTPFPSPTLTPTVVIEASCPLLTSEILDTATDFEFDSEENADEEIYLVSYFVNGDEISRPFNESVPQDLRDEQDDRATHQDIWKYFTRLIPPEQRDFLSGFEQDGDVIGRPVDVAEGPDGAFYVSDDYAGAVYRVTYGSTKIAAR